MENKFSTSTNILRDAGRQINYVSTPNAKRVFQQLEKDFQKGIHSFNLIGSYGTGKSSFLWAFEKSVQDGSQFFDSDFLRDQEVEVWKFVGKYGSIIDTLATYLELDSTYPDALLSKIFNKYFALKSQGKGLVFIIDEFGKFLEYASKNNPERELYFIQELAEFINNPANNTLLITAVHQNFDAYSFGLNAAQRQEWAKVKGRFKEVTFNEPIEQLLFLAAESLSNQKTQSVKIKNLIDLELNLFESSKAFNLNQDYAKKIANKLVPLELFSANVLTLTLQKYGQNERSLFTFLESEDFESKSDSFHFYHLGRVYDYLVSNFYSFLNSRFNPDFAIWVSIKNALETIDVQWSKNLEEAGKIIKAIGLLNLTAVSGSKLDYNFLASYAENFLGISNAKEVIEELEKSKIIVYRAYNSRYSLFEGTDLDITEALTLAADKISDVVDVVGLLKKEYEFDPILAKAYSYKMGTPRLFEFVISEEPIQKVAEKDTDGFINLIFNPAVGENEVKEISKNTEEAIIYGYFKNFDTIKTQLFEIEKTRNVIEENLGDKVALKELNNILAHQKKLLSHYVVNNLYNDNKYITWFFRGSFRSVKSKKEFNKLLSEVCGDVYNKAPEFKNELVNRHKISSTIHTAKKNYLKALINNWDKEDLGFELTKFPPERTIYISLLKQNGLEPSGINFEKLNDSSFIHLWSASKEFLDSTKKNKKAISELSTLLSQRPFKLKQGLTDFWIASFLFLNRNDFALFSDSAYIPYLTDEILELVIKYPGNYQIKAFDLEGVKIDLFNSYRVFLNQSVSNSPSNDIFIETIKPFLVFYRDLKPYAKETTRLSKAALAIRAAIASSKEPERTFFEDFPIALGYSITSLQKSQENFNTYIQKLQDAIREIRTSLDALFDRLESFIQDELLGEKVDFEVYKQTLQNRYQKIQIHLCLPHQKTFLMRIDSPLEERNLWLSSICQAVIGVPLEIATDALEVKLYHKFKEVILELDSLNNLAASEFNEEKEEAMEIEIASFGEQKKKNILRLPKSKLQDLNEIQSRLEKSLTGEKRTDVYVLATLLKKLMD